MSPLFWFFLAVGSAFLMMASSRFAIKNSVTVAEKLNVSPFLIGITLVAVGTDTPEIINSIISSYLGKGDINVGDSIGSVFTQSTLILGLFPIVAGTTIFVERLEIFLISSLSIISLVIGLFLLSDSQVTRIDASILLFLWFFFTGIAWYFQKSLLDPVGDLGGTTRNVITHVVLALTAFGVVGIAASGLIRSIVALSSQLGIPEYILSFFGASLGTSLPELAVEFTALRKNQRQMAFGDVFGSCLVDSTLSLGIGPLLFPTFISANFAVKGSAIAIVGLFIAGILLVFRKKHDLISAALLIGLYMASYFFL